MPQYTVEYEKPHGAVFSPYGATMQDVSKNFKSRDDDAARRKAKKIATAVGGKVKKLYRRYKIRKS